MKIPELLSKSKKIVVKIGSSLLAKESGGINDSFVVDLASQIRHLTDRGKQLVLVSSGAIGAGTSLMQKWSRKRDLHYKQALASVGQVVLMETYRRELGKVGFYVGQILLTNDDFSQETRTLYIRNTLFTLADEGVIPIVNENDSVSVDEIKIGDNDTLAAHISILWGADLLVLISDVDGLYSSNPQTERSASLLEEIQNPSVYLAQAASEASQPGYWGTGGIQTKLGAACRLKEYGIPMILTSGREKKNLIRLWKGEVKASLFR